MSNLIALRTHVESVVKTIIDHLGVIEDTSLLVVDTLAIVKSGVGKRCHLTAFIGNERFTLIYAGQLLTVEWTTNNNNSVQTKWHWADATTDFDSTIVPTLVLSANVLCKANERIYIDALFPKISELARLTIPGYGSGLASYTVSMVYGLFYKYHFDKGLGIRVNFNMDGAVWVLGISCAGIWLKKTVHDVEIATYYVTYGVTWSAKIPKQYHAELKTVVADIKNILLLDEIIDINDDLYDSIINPDVSLFNYTPPDQQPW